MIYTNARYKAINCLFRRGVELPLLSGRLDWTQNNLKDLKIWKYKKDDIKNVILTGCSNITAEILNMAIYSEQTFRYRLS